MQKLTPDISRDPQADRPRRRDTAVVALQHVVDILILLVAFHAAYLLRFDFELPASELSNERLQILYVVTFQLLVVRVTGIQTFVWRYIGMADMTAFVSAAAWSLLPVLLIRFAVPDSLAPLRVPVSVALMDVMIAFGGLLTVRVLRRAIYERSQRVRRGSMRGQPDRVPILLIGAGRTGLAAAREIHHDPSLKLDVQGFVDDDPNNQGVVVQGIRVVGTTRDLPRLVHQMGIDHVILTVSEAPRREMRRISDICEQIPVKLRILPAISDILQNDIKLTAVRDVQIEDLLGREPVHLDQNEVAALLLDRTVMVTGAGGSIGSELTRQIARFKPSVLLLVERAEFALFAIEQELRQAWPQLTIVPLLADVGDEARMRAIFATHRPSVVVHAAAHKHVPMMECNCTEAIKNNVLGTRLLAELAGETGVNVFVLISTDKAVRPRSIMGASKRAAELAVQALNGRYPTRFVAVRFGNVIGSTGSVIPIFKAQILKGGPITVTHRDMMRYFMTIPEAAQLVLQAAAIGRGGEIFVLDMGEPIRIVELAKDLIRLSGLQPYEDIDIVFTGLRPGEKLYEELEVHGEGMTKTRHPKIYIGNIETVAPEIINRALVELADLTRAELEDEIRGALGDLVPEARLVRVQAAPVSVSA